MIFSDVVKIDIKDITGTSQVAGLSVLFIFIVPLPKRFYSTNVVSSFTFVYPIIKARADERVILVGRYGISEISAARLDWSERVALSSRSVI